MSEELEIAIGMNRALIRWMLTMLVQNGSIRGEDIVALATNHELSEPEHFLFGSLLREHRTRSDITEQALEYFRRVAEDAKGLASEQG